MTICALLELGWNPWTVMTKQEFINLASSNNEQLPNANRVLMLAFILSVIFHVALMYVQLNKNKQSKIESANRLNVSFISPSVESLPVTQNVAPTKKTIQVQEPTPKPNQTEVNDKLVSESQIREMFNLRSPPLSREENNTFIDEDKSGSATIFDPRIKEKVLQNSRRHQQLNHSTGPVSYTDIHGRGIVRVGNKCMEQMDLPGATAPSTWTLPRNCNDAVSDSEMMERRIREALIK